MIPIRKYKLKLHVSEFQGPGNKATALRIPAAKVLEYALGYSYDEAMEFLSRFEDTTQECIINSNQLGALVAAERMFLKHGLSFTDVEEFEYPKYNDFTQIP